MNFSVVVPTLNEEKNLGHLLESIRSQTRSVLEVIVVDGGSSDRTEEIGHSYDAKVIVSPGASEFEARNIGADRAIGTHLINTCADIVWPNDLVERIEFELENDPLLVGLSGPGIPVDPPIWGKVEYSLFNASRIALANWGRFMTSTNFLVYPKAVLEKVGPFELGDVNADGRLGRRLQQAGKVRFSPNLFVFISSRRMRSGPLMFNKTFVYVIENVFPILGRLGFFRRFKQVASSHHRRRGEAPR